MNSSTTRTVLTGLLAVAMLGGSGWIVYSKWLGDGSVAGVNDTDADTEITGLIDPDEVLIAQDISPPTSDDFDRLSITTDAFPVSGNSDSNQWQESGTTALDVGENSGEVPSGDEFVIGDDNPSDAVTTDNGFEESDSFVIGDQSALESYTADATAGEFVVPDTESETGDTPVAPVFDEDTSGEFQISDRVQEEIVDQPSPVESGNREEFSISDIPAVPDELTTDLPEQPNIPVDLSDAPAVPNELEVPDALNIADEPDLTPLPLPGQEFNTPDLDPGIQGMSEASLTAQPGSLQLEGQQSPSLTVEKVAPAEVQVNRSAVFTTRIKNTGKVAAHGIRVIDFVPEGSRLESAHPAEFIRANDGSLQWKLGTLEPGDETTVSMKLVPLAEGEIGSVARVSFEALASVRTVSTRPQLSIKQTAPEKVLIGKSVLVNVTVANPGSGDATGVVLEADIPAELSHVAGNELEYPIGTLRSGQQKQVALRLSAKAAGVIFNTLTVRGNGQMEDRSVQQIEVVAPDVQVGLRGPKIRYLDREATYAVDVANPGTASAKNVKLVAFLSKGLKFVSTDHLGEYDAREHAVSWNLEELPPNFRDSVKLTAVAIEPGEQKIVLEGTADLGVKDSFDHIVRVESVPELEFSVKDTADPIEVGSDTTYEIKVVNRGTRTATGVQIYAAFPASLRAIQGGGPSDLRIEGQNALFAPLDRLAPNQEAVFRVKAKALGAGDNVIKVQMISDDVNVPVTKEESTRIYSDN